MKGNEIMKLNSLLSRQMKSVESYSYGVPSRKIQGQFGGNADTEGFTKVAILLDASRNKDFNLYVPALKQANQFFIRKQIRAKIHIVIWASEAIGRENKG